ncbi:glucan phosphorylase [Providencia alcalifaciens]|nr:glucan phosphorylase [Providencia alcalifaciens]
MFFLNWLFDSKKNYRHSKLSSQSKHARRANSERREEQYENQNSDIYTEINKQHLTIMQCKRYHSILNLETKFCSQCGLSV